MNRDVTVLLQNYNERHYWEFMGYAKMEIDVGWTGCLKYAGKVIPGTVFDSYDELEDLLLNG